MGGVAGAIVRRQVAPKGAGNPEHGVDEAAVVPGGASRFARAAGQDQFQDSPRRGRRCRAAVQGTGGPSAVVAQTLERATLMVIAGWQHHLPPEPIFDHTPWIYTRVCGGIQQRMSHRKCVMSLSPRVRGNRAQLQQVAGCHGSIPACAGEPITASTRTTRWRVYPRVCGGTNGCCWRLGPRGGLSPRVRGNQSALQRRIRPSGSIPACAGEP